MTKKDFDAIARALRDARDAALVTAESEGGKRVVTQVFDSLCRDLAPRIASTNPKFDRSRFLIDCGVPRP